MAAKARAKRQPSSIDRLPPELQDTIARLRREGRTVTEIHDHLQQLDAGVSRSAIGRHVKTMAEIGEEMRLAEQMARFWVEEFGEGADARGRPAEGGSHSALTWDSSRSRAPQLSSAPGPRSFSRRATTTSSTATRRVSTRSSRTRTLSVEASASGIEWASGCREAGSA